MVTTPQPDRSYFIAAIESALRAGGINRLNDFAPHEAYQALKLCGWEVAAREATAHDEWSIDQLVDLAIRLEHRRRWVPGHPLHQGKLSPVEVKKAAKRAEKRDRELRYYAGLPISTLLALIEMEDSEITRGLMVQAANAQWHALHTAAQAAMGGE